VSGTGVVRLVRGVSLASGPEELGRLERLPVVKLAWVEEARDCSDRAGDPETPGSHPPHLLIGPVYLTPPKTAGFG